MKIIRIHEVLAIVKISRSLWYQSIRDGDAPRPIKPGPRVSFWIEEEVHAWLDRKAAERFQ
ncbi:AlpA family phage regulatory protein [Arsukibacterium perlucidum]|uniref:helix-turn-helix transcriptional regulator n=1 Tax=Arsukibacterium perlucidum TaxID=368811 RepID=UPI000369558A